MSVDSLSFVPANVARDFISTAQQARAYAKGGSVHTGHALLVNGLEAAREMVNRHEVGGSQATILFARELARYRERNEVRL